MDENGYFCFDQLQMLVIDEADRILDMGFKQQVYFFVKLNFSSPLSFLKVLKNVRL